MKQLTLVAVLLALGACGLAQREAFEREIADCRSRIPAERGQMVRRMECFNEASRRHDHSAGAELIRATRMVQAEKVDAGKISIAEGAAEVARVAFEVQQQSARTKAAILSAMPITHSTTCTGYGGTVSCFGQ